MKSNEDSFERSTRTERGVGPSPNESGEDVADAAPGRRRHYRPLRIDGLLEELAPHISWMNDDQRGDFSKAVQAAELVRAHDQLVALAERYPRNVTIKKTIALFRAQSVSRLEESLGGLHLVPRRTASFPSVRATERGRFAMLIDGATPIEAVLRKSKQDRLRGLESLCAWFRSGSVEMIERSDAGPTTSESSSAMVYEAGARISESIPPPAVTSGPGRRADRGSISQYALTPTGGSVRPRVPSLDSMLPSPVAAASVVPESPRGAPNRAGLRSPRGPLQETPRRFPGLITSRPAPVSLKEELDELEPPDRQTKSDPVPAASRRAQMQKSSIPAALQLFAPDEASERDEPEEPAERDAPGEDWDAWPVEPERDARRPVSLPALPAVRLRAPSTSSLRMQASDDVPDELGSSLELAPREPTSRPALAPKVAAARAAAAAASVESQRSRSARPPGGAASERPASSRAAHLHDSQTPAPHDDVAMGNMLPSSEGSFPRWLYLGAGALAIIGLVVGFVFVRGDPRPPAASTPPPATSSAPRAGSTVPLPAGLSSSPTPATTVSAEAAAATIKLTLDLEPHYAQVFIDGAKVNQKLKVHPLPRDGKEHTVRVEAAGYRKKKVTFNADADTRLVITLELVQPVQARPAKTPSTGIYE